MGLQNPTGVQGAAGSTGAGVDRSINVTTAGTTVVAANPTRSKILLKNDNAASITLKLDVTNPTVGPGLNQLVLNQGDYWPLVGYTGPITAISSSGTVPLFAREFG